MKKVVISIIGMMFVLVVLAAVGGYLYVNSIWNQPTQVLKETFFVPKGKGVSWVANQLESKGVIPNADVFKLMHRLKYTSIQVKAGEFDLSKPLSQHELISKFDKGEVVLYQVTLIDGWSFKQFKQHLIKQELLVPKIQDLSDDEILTAVGAEEAHPEGLFAPETYFFQKGDSDLDILKRSYQKQKEIVQNAWQQFSQHSQHDELSAHIDTPYKALILASIIEKETGKESERETISGVFYNRLKINMKLQTDPTVIYGMGDAFDGNIRRKNLRTDTPYNTYTRFGLPPTPIAMPGKASIEAALNPEATEAFYFVGKGDGSHYFSKNLKEHNNAVRKYQLGK